jgi:D-alanyl-D-alanine carboxypeptidase (penicillin-binding protein 5/6)
MGRLNTRDRGGGQHGPVRCLAMRMVLAAVAATLSLVISGSTAWADAGIQPVGTVPIPDGPAQTWLVADLDSGQVLAARDENLRHPPASTIKVLLALVALDELSLDSTVIADEADSNVECNCVGVKAGRSYTARQLLDGLLLVSGNDAANTLAHMLGGPGATVAKMDAKAASLGAVNTHASTPSGLDGPGGSGWSTAHDLAVIFRAALANPVFGRAVGAVPWREWRPPDFQSGRVAAALPGHDRRKDRLHRRRTQDLRRRRRTREPSPGGGDDVRAGARGWAHVLGSGRQLARLGFRVEPAIGDRRTVGL